MRISPFPDRFLSRKLLDIYGDSLLHVNRLYNDAYGHSSRMVVSHMPHLVDKNVFAEMRRKFDDAWRATSRHRIRQRDDMQFAFAYFHFLMSETKDFNVADVFREFDTDGSDTWSDREIRTLLTRVHDLPLTLKSIKAFEKMFVDCSANATPEFEGRGGEALATEMGRTLSHAYSDKKVFDLTALSVLSGRHCWILYVDILVRDQTCFNVLTAESADFHDRRSKYSKSINFLKIQYYIT